MLTLQSSTARSARRMSKGSCTEFMLLAPSPPTLAQSFITLRKIKCLHPLYRILSRSLSLCKWSRRGLSFRFYDCFCCCCFVASFLVLTAIKLRVTGVCECVLKKHNKKYMSVFFLSLFTPRLVPLQSSVIDHRNRDTIFWASTRVRQRCSSVWDGFLLVFDTLKKPPPAVKHEEEMGGGGISSSDQTKGG